MIGLGNTKMFWTLSSQLGEPEQNHCHPIAKNSYSPTTKGTIVMTDNSTKRKGAWTTATSILGHSDLRSNWLDTPKQFRMSSHVDNYNGETDRSHWLEDYWLVMRPRGEDDDFIV